MVMNAQKLRHPHYTLDAYFALEKLGEDRYEYWDGEIFCMSGGSSQHAIISSNIHREISNKLKGSKCRAFTSEMSIKTPSLPPYRYPDASVVCGELKFESMQGIEVLTNPILVIEVLSSTTEDVDRNEKRLAYQDLPSLMEYVLISQAAPQITRYARHGEFWHRSDFGDPNGSLELTSIECQIPLAEIYEGVVFT
jgi:Uma2 family endonuclease